MRKYYPVLAENLLIPGKGIKIKFKHYKIALFKDGDNIYAVQSNCPHQNADLSDGYIVNDRLYCSLHNWAFSLPDGRYIFNPEMRLKTYETKTLKGMIYVAFDE